jgi:hypothetical protein
MNHPLDFMGQVTAQCASQAPTSSPLWLQVIQAAGGLATTVGVLIALYIALIRDPRESSEEHRHHVAQMAALQRAKAERASAHARKVVPSCARAPVLGDSWWTVKIDNESTASTTIVVVDVTAVDSRGVEVPDGCRPADNARSALAESLGAELQRPLAGTLQQTIDSAVTLNFVKEWPRTLPPLRHAVMAYTVADPDYRLRVTVDYEDDEGFQWRRTDSGGPRRTDVVDTSPAAMQTPQG